MGWFSRSKKAVAPAAEKSATGVSDRGWLTNLGAVTSASGAMISPASAMMVSTVFACVTIRSEDVARCAPSLYRPLKDGSRELVTDHPVAKLFRRPNRLQTWFEFVEQMHAWLLLRGNAYAIILRDSRGRPTEMIPCSSDGVIVLEASDGTLFYSVARVGLFQMAALRDLPMSIPAEDVLHLRGMAFNATVGANRLGLARDSVGVALSLLQQVARWMANGARPSGLLKVAKSLSEDASKRLKAAWNSLFSGVQNIGATAVLEDGVEWQPMTLTSVDLEFIEQRKMTVLELCQWFRMPPHKVGVTDGMSKMNAPQADQDYVNNVIMPDLERWEQKLMRTFDLDLEGLEVDMDENKLLRADILTRINVGRLGVLSGLTTTNEWRKSEKLSPVEGGDEVRAPVNLAELGSDTTGTAPDGAGRPQGSTQDAPPNGNDQPQT